MSNLKSAEEWYSEFTDGKSMLSAVVGVDDIQSIQQDAWQAAMERAAEIVKAHGDFTCLFTRDFEQLLLSAKNELEELRGRES